VKKRRANPEAPRARAGELGLCRVTFTIPESTVEVLRRVGSGNASLGVRRAAEHMADCDKVKPD